MDPGYRTISRQQYMSRLLANIEQSGIAANLRLIHRAGPELPRCARGAESAATAAHKPCLSQYYADDQSNISDPWLGGPL